MDKDRLVLYLLPEDRRTIEILAKLRYVKKDGYKPGSPGAYIMSLIEKDAETVKGEFAAKVNGGDVL